MKKFTLTVTETLQRQIEVFADDADDAMQQVSTSYRDGDIVLDADDFVGHNVVIEGADVAEG